MGSSSLVSWIKKNESAIILINNPPVNALSQEVFDQLSVILDEVEADTETNIVIFAGLNQEIFIAGANIKEFPEWAEKGRSFVELKSLELQHVFNKIDNMKKPTIAAINGLTLGGGCEFVLCCDIRVMDEQAVIGLPEIKLGLFPGAGGTQRLPRLIGEARAKEMMFTGQPVNGKEAERIGLANHVVPQGKAMEKAEEIANQISKFSLPALSLMKQAINEGLSTSLREGLQIEAENFGKVFETEDVKEGLEAFIQKRTPNFKNQ